MKEKFNLIYRFPTGSSLRPNTFMACSIMEVTFSPISIAWTEKLHKNVHCQRNKDSATFSHRKEIPRINEEKVYIRFALESPHHMPPIKRAQRKTYRSVINRGWKILQSQYSNYVCLSWFRRISHAPSIHFSSFSKYILLLIKIKC